MKFQNCRGETNISRQCQSRLKQPTIPGIKKYMIFERKCYSSTLSRLSGISLNTAYVWISFPLAYIPVKSDLPHVFCHRYLLCSLTPPRRWIYQLYLYYQADHSIVSIQYDLYLYAANISPKKSRHQSTWMQALSGWVRLKNSDCDFKISGLQTWSCPILIWAWDNEKMILLFWV